MIEIVNQNYEPSEMIEITTQNYDNVLKRLK